MLVSYGNTNPNRRYEGERLLHQGLHDSVREGSAEGSQACRLQGREG